MLKQSKHPYERYYGIENEEQPEEDVIILATRVVVLTKLSRVTGALAFMWATVVLLGGLIVGSISSIDFWFIIALLVIGGVRALVITQEFECQRVFAKCFAKSKCQNIDVEAGSRRAAAAARPKARQKTVRQLRILQLLFCCVSLALAAYRIGEHNFGKLNRSASNRNNALYIYYCLTILEVVIFLALRTYWWVSGSKLFRHVSQKCKLEDGDLVSMFYEFVYSRSLTSSFEGIGLDLIDFGMEKIKSNRYEEQLAGVTVLAALVKHPNENENSHESNNENERRIDAIKEERARKFATTPRILERVLDMLTWSWRNEKDQDIIRGAAVVLDGLVHYRIICFRIGAIAGGLEGIASVVINNTCKKGPHPTGMADERHRQELKLLALNMLKKLAKEHSHCVKIGQTRGLIAALVSSINVDSIQNSDPTGSMICDRSLQILDLLAETIGGSTKDIRNEIVRQLSALDTLRDLLKSEIEKFKGYALAILKNLALEPDLKDAIGNTGNMIYLLMILFIDNESLEAAKVLNSLAWHNRKNCKRIARDESALFKFKNKLENGSNARVSIRAAKILRSLCANLPKKTGKIASEAARHVMGRIKERIKVLNGPPTQVLDGQEENELLEAYLGLAKYIVPAVPITEPDVLKDMPEAVSSLLGKLPSFKNELPRIRRHAVEVVIELMKKGESFCKIFNNENIEMHLDAMTKSLSHAEDFNSVSGTMGVSQYNEKMEDLIKIARKTLARRETLSPVESFQY